MKKRLLAMMMAFVMAMSLLPMSALAVDGESTDDELTEGEVRASKALVLDEYGKPVIDSDGCYTIQITVQGKPKQTTTGSNADVVLVVDNSGSMGSSVGETCNTPKEEFSTEWTLFWYTHTCPVCGAKYSSDLLGGNIWDTRPDNCTGEKGTISRINAAKAVSQEFASSIHASGSGNQLAVIGFAHQNKDGGANDTGAIKVDQGLTTDLSAINSKIDTMEADGGTNYTAALQKAYNYLNSRSDKSRPGYVIFISDGAPGRSGESLKDPNWNGSNQITALKNAGITVYTVGIALETNAAEYLKNMASDVKNDHFINVKGTNYKDQLSNILKTWANQINTVPAGRDAVLTDIVDIDKFEIFAYDMEKLGLATDGKTFTWNIGDITENEQTAWIKIKAKTDVYGENIPTNENVYLDYTDTDGKSAKKEKSEIGEPKVTIEAPTPVTAEYTVEYYYGTVKDTAPEGAPQKGEANVGDTVTITAGDTAGDKMFPKKTQVDTKKYAFDEGAENVLSKEISATEQNVLKVYYALDANGDGIPDKYQAFVKFESVDSNGEVTGAGISQVFTFKDTTTGKYLTSGNVTPSLEKVTTVPDTGYTFDYWTKDKETDEVIPSDMIPNVQGGTTITFKAHWKLHTIDVTFDANGGAWNESTTIDGYTLSDSNQKATAQKTTNDTVKAITGPTYEGMKFTGWGVKLDSEGRPSDEITPFYALSIGNGVSVSALQAVFGESPIIFYAMWEASTPPVEKLNYTIHQHYMGSDGKQVAQFNDKLPKAAPSGTSITSLFDGNDQNQTYEGQTYIYLAPETKIKVGENTTPVTDDTTLTANDTEIHLYYYLDAWKDAEDPKDDSETGGDGTADIYQVRVKYEAAEEEGTVTPALEILTIPGNAASGSVDPAGSTATAAPGYAFDYWQENGTDVKTYEKVLNPAERTATGGSTITFTAYFDVDTKGKIEAGKETGDGIPDKYQAFVKFESVDSNGEVTGAGISQVFTFKDTDTGKYLTSGSVTPSLENVNTVPDTGYTLDYWTKDEEPDSVVPSKMIPNVQGGTTITFKAHWKLHTIDVTFDANGGAWNKGTTIDGYTLSDSNEKATAQKTTNDTVKAITGPTCEGMKFTGWGVKLDSEGELSDEITPFYALSIGNGVSVSALQAVFGESPIIFYAMWEASTPPVEKLNYTIHQHYMGSDGKQVAQFNDKLPKAAPSGTSITSLFDGNDQTYEGQTYIYLASETKIKVGENTTPVTDGTTLTANDTEIHLYYYLDAWKDEEDPKDDSETGGDGTADIYQVRVKYEAAKEEGTVTPALEILTIPENATSGSVAPAGSTATAAPGYAFDYWQENGTDVKTYEKVLNPAERTATGGSTITFTAYFDVDTKGKIEDGKETGDDIPDKYQKKVTFKVVNGAWNDKKTNDVIKYVTLTDKDSKWDVGGSYTVTEDDVKNIPAVGSEPNSGYKAGSWDALYQADDSITADVTFTYTYAKKSSNNNGGGSSKPPVLNKEDHYAYIVGYPDGTVKPQGNITRAEVATIFFRMLTDDSRNEFWSQTNSYSDVSEGQWFNNAISTLANAGILSGYPDGTFRPNAPITRAEFTKIAASFFERVEYTIDNPFNDVDDDDWFYKFVMAAYEGGLITGYPEGDFRPNANISRAESVTIVNRTLERAPDADHFLKDMIVWPDNAENAWYYEAVQEATNSHEYVVKGTGTNKYEEWTKILEVRDWPALEKEWSNANSATGGEVVK